jgi:hypothetical protein
LNSVSVPSVAMNALTPAYDTSRPLSSPAASPTPRPVATATPTAASLSASIFALMTIARLAVAPTDRSKSPTTMTIV